MPQCVLNGKSSTDGYGNMNIYFNVQIIHLKVKIYSF